MDAKGDDGLEDRGEEVGLSDLAWFVKLVLTSRRLASGLAALWATLVWSWRKLKEFRLVMLRDTLLIHMRMRMCRTRI